MDIFNQDNNLTKSIFETAQAIILVLDKDGAIMACNSYMEEVCGYKLEEIKGKDWFETFLPEQDHAKIRAVFRQAINDIQTRGKVNPIRTKDGRLLYIEWSDKTLKDSEGSVIGLLAIGLDITARKVAEEKLRKSEKLFRGVFESKMIGNLFWDADGYIFDANDTFLEMVGYSREELSSGVVRWRDMTPPEYREQDDKVMQEIIDKGYFNPIEKEYICKDGTLLPILLGGASIQGSSVKGVAYVIDISKRKEMEAQLVQSSKLASLGEMATGIAHEINQPLSYLKIFLESLVRDIKNDQFDLTEIIDDSHESLKQIDRIVKIVNHLRLFGRDENTVCHKINLKRVLENTNVLMGHRMKLKNIRYDEVTPSELPAIRGNASQLEQVFINLFQNSIDAMTGEKEHTISVLCYTENNKVKVQVTDNGEGIPFDIRQKIFDPFFTTKEPGRGTGIGLSIVYAIIEDHRGTISYTPAQEGGAIFTITLPLSN